MAAREGEAARLTRATRRSNWRKSFTLITTWRGGGGSKSLTPFAWRSVKSKFGFKIDAWSSRRSSEPSRKLTSRPVVSARSRRVRSAIARETTTTAVTRANISSIITLRLRITSSSNITDSSSNWASRTDITSIITICCKPPLRPTTRPTSAKWPPRAWHKSFSNSPGDNNKTFT